VSFNLQKPEEAPQDLNKRAIFQLLRKFKLQQYSNQMSKQGYSNDIFTLAFLSYRERDELMVNLNMLPGHRDKMNELFKIIEHLNPKNQIKLTLQNAMKVKRKESREPIPKTEEKIARLSDSVLSGQKFKIVNQNVEPSNAMSRSSLKRLGSEEKNIAPSSEATS